MDRVKDWNFSHGFDAAQAAGFQDHELMELRLRWSTERDRELRRRVSHVPRKMRERIHWDAAIENLIPIRPGNITPCLGYMVVPIRAEIEPEEFNVLVLSPSPQKAVEIRWPWSSEFLPWLVDIKAERGVPWVQMMTEEFGLPEYAQHAWASPHAGASVLDIRKHSAFYRELKTARILEAQRRIEAIAGWLTAHGLDGLVDYAPHIVIRGTDDDYDPEISTFIFSVSLSGDNTCLVSRPLPRDPIYLHEPFKKARKFVACAEWIDQHLWLIRQFKDR